MKTFSIQVKQKLREFFLLDQPCKEGYKSPGGNEWGVTYSFMGTEFLFEMITFWKWTVVMVAQNCDCF